MNCLTIALASLLEIKGLRFRLGLGIERSTALIESGHGGGTLISFRVGAEDAPILVAELQEEFTKLDLLQLPNYRIYIRLMIDGTPTKPFSAMTLRHS